MQSRWTRCGNRLHPACQHVEGASASFWRFPKVRVLPTMSAHAWYPYMTEAVVRSAAEHDLPEMLNLYRHLHPHDPQLETATAERVWSNLLASSFMTVIVAQAAERLVASCTLAIVPNLSRGGRSYGVIENVVTHADYRRMGLGRRVLALDVAWQADCYKVLLATGSKQETTLRFYEGAGFHRGGKTYFEVRRP
jgi:ribosomal protein S18 acetylase RimI-like enzyme